MSLHDSTSTRAPCGQIGRILVVGACTQASDALASTLTRNGCGVDVRVTFNGALLQLCAQRPDALIVVDPCGPDADLHECLAFAHSIREDPAIIRYLTRRPLLVAIIEGADATLEVRLRQAGFDRVLPSPVDIHRLRAMLSGHCKVENCPARAGALHAPLTARMDERKARMLDARRRR